MSLIRWDPFAEVNTLIRLMPAGAAGFPRLRSMESVSSKPTTRTRSSTV
jgi:hypothetical protein